MSIRVYLKRIDWLLMASAVLLTVMGILTIYSIASSKESFLIFKKQIIFFAISIALAIFFTILDWRNFRDNSYILLFLYGFCILLLIGLFFFAPNIRGVKGWYKIGGISFDPVNLTEIVLVLLLAKYFSKRHIEMYKVSHIFLSGVYVFLPASLIFFQPDFGSALIFIVLWISILLVSGVKLKHFLLLVLIGLLILVFCWQFLLKDYQKARVLSFLNPEGQVLSTGWSQAQSKIAIGSGGFFGKGLKKNFQVRYGFLPEPHTDFIFSAIAEEFGLSGVLILFLLYFILFWRIVKIAKEANNNFPRLFAIGFLSVLFSQFFIHIGMNVGILPVIGISLPFVSYGGSGLMVMFLALGILQSIKVHS